MRESVRAHSSGILSGRRTSEIQEYTDPDNDPMIPHTIVLRPGLVVHKIYNGYWFWGRPSFAELWQDLREGSRRDSS